ncbi:MAG: DEAD/DEAH box helicase [Bdellovibrionota bacterium]
MKQSEISPSLETPFSQLLQSPQILSNLSEKMGFKTPTAIQEAVIPVILKGLDLYAGAKTGSGKTVAFVAPLAQLLLENKVKKALVLSPTRELAIQIDEEAMKVFGDDPELVSIPLYGGVPLDQQVRALKIHRPRLYVATPGRFLDFISEGLLALSDIEVCVLDEADRMCDMGFSPQIEEILNTLPNLRQVLMFSATLPKEATLIMERYLKSPVKIQIGNPAESNESIEHFAYIIGRRDKMKTLSQLLREDVESAVIFTRTRKGADRLHDSLRQKKVRAGILHAGYSMSDREKTLRAYREGKLKVLVATDVAARGLDIDHVTHVIHFDLPESSEDYIHRSGRSGRAGRKGTTIALIEKESSMQRAQLESLSKNISIQVLDFDKGRKKSNSTERVAPERAKAAHKNHKKKPSKPRNAETFSKKDSLAKRLVQFFQKIFK